MSRVTKLRLSALRLPLHPVIGPLKAPCSVKAGSLSVLGQYLLQIGLDRLIN